MTAYHVTEKLMPHSWQYKKIGVKICDETDFSSFDHKERFKKVEDVFKSYDSKLSMICF